MTAEYFSELLGDIEDELITEARGEKSGRKRPRLLRGLAAAACAVLVAIGAIDTLGRFDYGFRAGCGAYPGTIADGTYYYYMPHKGVMAYEPGGESRLVLSTYWMEEWQANDYGVYYWQGLKMYVREHATGQRRRLYSVSPLECSHIRFALREDGDVFLTCYNKRTEVVYELLLDGVTGELIDTVMEPTGYDDYDALYSDRYLSAGEREFLLVRTEHPTDERSSAYLLTENGENILPEGTFTGLWSSGSYGGALCVLLSTAETAQSGEWPELRLFLHPDGRNELAALPYESYDGGTEEYLFFVENGGVGCAEVATGETWMLAADTGTEAGIHDLASDGEYIYTCAPWAEEQACWEIICGDDGRPSAIALVRDDIASDGK